MTTYTFSAAPATLMGPSPLDSAKGAAAGPGSGGSGAGSGSGLYDGVHIYRHDSAMAAASPHHADRPSHYHHYHQPPHQQQQHSVGTASRALPGSHATAGGDGGNAQTQLTRALTGTDGHANTALADYLFEQQVMSLSGSQDSSRDAARQALGRHNNSHHHHQPSSSSSSDISSMVAAVAAATAATTPASIAHTRGPYGAEIQSPTAPMLLGTRAPSSTATTTPISADSAHQPSGLPDPLPGFFSSLPAQGVTDPSKYAGVVAGASAAINNGAHDSGGGNSSGSGGNRESARATQGSGLLNAAAAAAAASVASGAGHPDAYRHPGGPVALLDAGYPQGSSPYARHPYSGAPATLLRPQEQSSYALDGFSLSSHGPTATPALGPSLSEQSVAHINTAASAAAELARGGGGESEPASAAVLAGAASSPDLTAYSLSAFSRPLGQQTDSAAVLLGSNPGNYAGGCSSVNTPGLVGSLSAVGHISGVVSPPPQQSVHYYQQQPQQQQQQQQQQPPHQQRGYSDYSSYYRSPSTTLGMGGAAAQATNAAGASPLNDPGLDGIGSGATSSAGTGVSQLSAAAAAAAAAAMGPAYYAPTAYQQYARSAAVGAQSAAYSYYYSQPSARYLPYAAYPPVRHFVSPARPFKCETCEQSFSRNHDLKRHVKIHSGVKPHKCPKCGKSFGRSDALKRHSMVKRCRSSTAGNAESSSGSQGAESAGSASSQRQTVSARLAPVSSLFSQPATATPSSSAIMSTMLASRANPI